MTPAPTVEAELESDEALLLAGLPYALTELNNGRMSAARLWMSAAAKTLSKSTPEGDGRAAFGLEERNKVIEECAKIAEGNVHEHRYRKWPWWPKATFSAEDMPVRLADKIAAAIRALSKQCGTP